MSNNKPSYFDLLSLSPRFDLDLEALERCYLERIREAHPDQQEGNGHASSQLNRAYQTLLDPLSRAQHLLGLHAGEVTETIQDMVLLQQSLEDREKLATAEDLEDLQRLKKSAKKHVQDVKEALTVSFGKDLIALKEVAHQVSAFSYHMKYLTQVEEKIFEGEERRVVANF